MYLRAMEYITRLKLSPVESLADARFAAAAGFTYLGFCFDPTRPEFMVPIRAKEIVEWTSGAFTVGEFGHQDMDTIRDMSSLLGLDVIQIRNSLLPDEVSTLELPVIKTIDLSVFSDEQALAEFEAYENVVAAFQLEGRQPEINILKQWCSRYPIILGFGNDLSRSAIEIVQPFGLTLQPGKEEKTGIQDFDALQQVVEALAV